MNTLHYINPLPPKWNYYLNDVKVEEPLDWEDVFFDWARNKDSDGVVMMPSIPVRFGGRGAELIRQWAYTDSQRAMTLKITKREPNGVETVYYEGDLSGETFRDENDSVEVQTEENGIENIVNAKKSVVYEVSTKTPLGDGSEVQDYIRYDRMALTLEYKGVNELGVSRLKVPRGGVGYDWKNIPLPLDCMQVGQPNRFRAAAPDMFEALEDGTVLLSYDCNFSGGAPVVTDDPNNPEPGKVSLSSGLDTPEGMPRIWVICYDESGNQVDGSIASFPFNSSGTVEVKNVKKGYLLTVQVRGYKFSTRGGQELGDDRDYYLRFAWPRVDGSKPLLTVTHTTNYRGPAVDIPSVLVITAFQRLLRMITGDDTLTVSYATANNFDLSHRLFTQAGIKDPASGVIKLKYNDFKAWFNMLGYGIVFERYQGTERVRVVDTHKTGRTPTTWPLTSDALIADAGDDWHDFELVVDEASLFTAVNVGFSKEVDYDIIPYIPDPVGQSTYNNAQRKSDTVKDLTVAWRADGLGIEDILLQGEIEEGGGSSSSGGDQVWVMKCDLLPQFGNAVDRRVYAPYRVNNGGLSLPYVQASTLVNMDLRASELMRGVAPLLAVPVAGVKDKSYVFASSLNANKLTVDGFPDTEPVSVKSATPLHLPWLAKFSSSIRANLYAIMGTLPRRYGYISFMFKGVTINAFIKDIKINPTEESSQRCELYPLPDTDLTELII